MKFCFSEFELNTETRTLSRASEEIAVEPKVFDVLVYLIEHRDRMISRDELLDKCWPNIFVSDGTLSRCLSRIRQALGQKRGASQPIHTLHSKGYRFVGELLSVDTEGAPRTPELEPVKTAPPDEPMRRFLSIMVIEIFALDESGYLDPQREDTFVKAAAEIAALYNCSMTDRTGDALVIRVGLAEPLERPAKNAHVLSQALRKEAARVQIDLGIGISSGLASVQPVLHGSRQNSVVTGISPLRAELTAGITLVDTTSADLLRKIVPMTAVSDGVYQLYSDSSEDDGRFVPSGRFYVGRSSELFEIEARWRQARSAGFQFVTITGEPGIGKTEFLRQFINALEHDAVRVIDMYCLQAMSNTQFFPVLGYIMSQLEIDRSTSPIQIMQKIEKLLEGTDEPVANHLPLLVSLLSVSMGEQRLSQVQLKPEDRRARTLEALETILRTQIVSGETILFVDDAQWIDPSSITLLENLLTRLQKNPVMLVTCVREYDERFPQAFEIPLKRLSKQQSAQLLNQMSDAGFVAPKHIETIAERSEGVPLFLHEIINMTSRAKDANNAQQALSVPDSLQGVLSARLVSTGERLPIVQWASVIGRQFDLSLLSKTIEKDEDALQVELEALVDADILSKPKGAGVGTYLFSHALLRDAGYESMPLETRRAHHLRVGQVMEVLFPDVCQSAPELVAIQFAASSQPERAAAYWRAAGELSMNSNALIEARHLFRQALEAAQSTPENTGLASEIEGLLNEF